MTGINSGSINSASRLASLDLLRGIAILGILFMNIVAFAMPEPAYANVNWDGRATEIDKLFFALQYMFAKERFIALFCVLFGAGLVMFWQRAQEKLFEPIPLLRKRVFWLFVFGILHMAFLFYGDVLVTYAICGFLIIKYIPDDENKLMRRGILFTFIGMCIVFFIALLMLVEIEPDAQTSIIGYPYSPERVVEVIDSAVGSYFTMIQYNVENGAGILLLWPVLFWIIAGSMLIGMSLIKQGFFLQGVSTKVEASLVVIGLMMSSGQLYMILMGNFSNDFWLIAPFNTIGGLLLIIGIASRLIKVIANNPHWLMPLQYVGRMAFSLYILQSIVMTLLFRVLLSDYFGLWHLGTLMGIAVIASVIQIALAHWWQTTKGQGPLEKLWRVVIYKNATPIHIEK